MGTLLATTLFPVLGDDCFDDLLAALVDGYQEVRPLPPEFEEMLPVFFLLRGFTYLGWVHARSETASAKSLAPLVGSERPGLEQRALT